MRTSHHRLPAHGAILSCGLLRRASPFIAVCAIGCSVADPAFPAYTYAARSAETAKRAPANNPTLNQAKRLIDAGQAEEAITILRRFLGTNPTPDVLDDTYLLLGAALYRAQQYAEA